MGVKFNFCMRQNCNLGLNLIINIIDYSVVCELCQEDTLEEDYVLWNARDKNIEQDLMFLKFGFYVKHI